MEEIMTTIPLLGAPPLEIFVGGRSCIVVDMDEAVRLLEDEWPEKAGVHYTRALRSCRLAMLRNGSAAVAREHLIAACLESGIPHEISSSFEADQLPLFAGQATGKKRTEPRV
ncbi:DUF982 domain-containing protein [Agrobacterium tumefaciens]|uniref:DUF982 domain-containing protein n=1 Tax=Agrobacterium tumefaciens TaxID=358 RepID=UPI002FDB5E83|nr:DUF982 domain-containing protein [Agrobacterium tumefaciens]